LGISNYIKFLGELDRSELNNLYKRSTLFVLPSYSENFGMSVIEAMAWGTPILISNKVGIFREIENANAGVIVTTNADNVKNGILKLLNDDKYANQISENGKKLVKEKYNIEKVADQMIQQYTSIIRSYK
ncbi:MAG TPA: glycosyltransferase family 4 protein, partial [Ignavibacteriaceae bacterium]|nr:glycosyltransferase family 4 protein [Ignavibacteriaceae bacterium]